MSDECIVEIRYNRVDVIGAFIMGMATLLFGCWWARMALHSIATYWNAATFSRIEMAAIIFIFIKPLFLYWCGGALLLWIGVMGMLWKPISLTTEGIVDADGHKIKWENVTITPILPLSRKRRETPIWRVEGDGRHYVLLLFMCSRTVKCKAIRLLLQQLSRQR